MLFRRLARKNMIVLGTMSMKFLRTMSKYDSMRDLMISVSMRSRSEGSFAGRRMVSGTCGSLTTVSCWATFLSLPNPKKLRTREERKGKVWAKMRIKDRGN